MTIDLHMHSTISDGTDTPDLLLQKIRQSGIRVFSLTDHDDYLGCNVLMSLLRSGDPLFIPGIEISTQEDQRKYHILGYGYSLDKPILSDLTHYVHDIRLKKLDAHLKWLQDEMGFVFDEADMATLRQLPNPGKPHIARLMMKTGRVSTISEGITKYLNKHATGYKDLTPQEAIRAIREADGIPVLAHGIYGNGSQYLTPEELEDRIRHLTSLGLMGVECYYSRYTDSEQTLTRKLCASYHLLATAGSDYHGDNKPVHLGQTHLLSVDEDPLVQDFLNECQAHHTTIKSHG